MRPGYDCEVGRSRWCPRSLGSTALPCRARRVCNSYRVSRLAVPNRDAGEIAWPDVATPNLLEVLGAAEAAFLCGDHEPGHV